MVSQTQLKETVLSLNYPSFTTAIESCMILHLKSTEALHAMPFNANFETFCHTLLLNFRLVNEIDADNPEEPNMYKTLSVNDDL